MKIWRINLKGTDLYYQPVKGRFKGEKSNLGPRGKVYLTKPSLKHVGESLYISDSLCKKYPDLPMMEGRCTGKQKYTLSKGNLQIIEYDCVEKGD